MGAGGPKPKPRALKVQKGTLRKVRDVSELEVEPIKLYPDPPETLKKYAVECWSFLVPKLQGYNVLSETDLWQLRNMCYSYGEWRECCDEVEAKGRTYMTEKGNLMPHPMVHIASSHFKNYNQIAAKFGLTPSDRVGLPNTAPKKVDPLDELLKQAQGQ